MSEDSTEKYSAEEWDYIRERFSQSILKETEIANLGQNVGISWPFKGTDETPSRYMDLNFEDLQSVPGLIGKKSRIKLLMDILRETLAFDDPFGDMVTTVESTSRNSDTFMDILEKFGISADYPVEYLHFDQETKDFLKEKGAKTLSESVQVGQNLGQYTDTGYDLISFLNSLAHRDERIMAKHMPYRRGEPGLHLAEAIGLVCEDLDSPTKFYFMSKGGITLTAEEQQILSTASDQDIEIAVKRALDKLVKLTEWFRADADELKEIFAAGGQPGRFFIMISEPQRERMAVELSKLHFAPEAEKKSGFLGRIFGR